MTALALVAPGDTITSAQQNIVRTDFTVLDARTGGDPGAAGRIPVSDGAASSIWTAAYAAIIAGLGYTPANKAGDVFGGSIAVTGNVGAVDLNLSGNIGAAGSIVANGGINGGNYAGGSTSTGTPSFKGVVVGTDGIASTGPISPASYAGGSTSAGSPSVKGLNVGTDGVSIGSAGVGPLVVAGSVTPGSYAGGSTSAGIPSVLGLNVGTSGIGISGQINSSVPNGTPPFVIASATQVPNLNAFMLQGIQATATPTGSRIPISDSSGLLDSWVSPSAGAVPAGMGCLWSNTIASIPAGWSRWTNMNGRIPVSAGTTFSTTFVEGTSYGSSWSHNHSTPAHAHSGSPLSVSGTASASGSTLNGRFQAGGATALPDTHTHPFSASVAGNTATDGSGTSGDTAWVIPMFAVVAVTKN